MLTAYGRGEGSDRYPRGVSASVGLVGLVQRVITRGATGEVSATAALPVACYSVRAADVLVAGQLDEPCLSSSAARSGGENDPGGRAHEQGGRAGVGPGD